MSFDLRNGVVVRVVQPPVPVLRMGMPAGPQAMVLLARGPSGLAGPPGDASSGHLGPPTLVGGEWAVPLTSNWGVTSAGAVYYDPAGAVPDEAAVASLDVDGHFTVTDLDASLAPTGGIYPAARYGSLQAAIDACSAGGGGTVLLPVGATVVTTTIEMKSKVILSGPDNEWSVWGYNSSPQTYQTTWLNADATTGPVINFGTSVVDAGVRNLLVLANERVGINLALAGSTRGGNRLRNVYVNGASTGVYIGQKETHLRDVIIMACTGDGIRVDAQDCDWITGLVGFCGGNGINLTTNSGPIRMQIIDTFDNMLDGLLINGDSHLISAVQSNNNGRRGVNFSVTTRTIVSSLIAQSNGREYTGSAPNTTRYPDVAFSHPTAGNSGCAILGGNIYSNDAIQSYAVQSTEANVTFPRLVGVNFSGSYNTGNSPYGYVNPLSNMNTRGCNFVPDVVMPQGGVAGIYSRPNGPADQAQFTDGSGTVLTGIKSAGALYLATHVQALASNGAVTIDAAAGNFQTVSLEANATSSAIANPTLGQQLTIEWSQDATGSRAYTWPANCKFAGGAAPTPSTTPFWSDSVTFRYDGTAWRELTRCIGLR